MNTHTSHLYYQDNNQFDKIAIGLIWFNVEQTFIEIKKEKLKIVKKLNPIGYELLKHTAYSFRTSYLEQGATYELIERASRYNNNMFQITPPSFISLGCTEENFNKYFDKYV
jgi:hypothetical protein